MKAYALSLCAQRFEDGVLQVTAHAATVCFEDRHAEAWSIGNKVANLLWPPGENWHNHSVLVIEVPRLIDMQANKQVIALPAQKLHYTCEDKA